MSAATPGPKDIPSFSFLTLTSDYPHVFTAATEGLLCRDLLTQFVTNQDLKTSGLWPRTWRLLV